MEKEFWQKNWAMGHTPWDTEGPNPLLGALLALAQGRAGLHVDQEVYVPGCGHGHDAFALAQAGYRVTACDFVPEAVAAAQSRYQHPLLRFEVKDVLEAATPTEAGRFAACFDRAMLVAFKPELRQRYKEAVSCRLKPGGLFMSILFSGPVGERQVPPFPLGREAMYELWQEDFTLVAMREVGGHGLVQPAGFEEALYIWRLRTESAL